MFEKMKLNKEIKLLKNTIEELEKKRLRSQSALVTAILEQKDPKDEDVEFFNNFTRQIDAVREQLILAEEKRNKL